MQVLKQSADLDVEENVINAVAFKRYRTGSDQLSDPDIETLFGWLCAAERPFRCESNTSTELKNYLAHFNKYQIFGNSEYRKYKSDKSGIMTTFSN